LDIVQTEISGLNPGGGIHRNFRLPRKNRYYVREPRIVDVGTTLIFSILFGSLGMGYFVYGKKQQAIVPLVAGLALCIFPYFVSSLYLMVLVGIVLTVLPWVI